MSWPRDSTGLRGVSYDKQTGKWKASATVYLGSFSAREEAAHARTAFLVSRWIEEARRALKAAPSREQVFSRSSSTSKLNEPAGV